MPRKRKGENNAHVAVAPPKQAYVGHCGYQQPPYATFAYWPSQLMQPAMQQSQLTQCALFFPGATFTIPVCPTPALSGCMSRACTSSGHPEVPPGINSKSASLDSSSQRLYSERPPGVFSLPTLDVEDEEEFEVIFRTMSGKERKLTACRPSWPVSELQKQLASLMEVEQESRLSIFTKEGQLLTDELGKKLSEFGIRHETELSVVLRYVCGPCGGVGCVFCNFGDKMTDEELLAHTQRFAIREAGANGKDWWDVDMCDQRRKDQLGIFG